MKFVKRANQDGAAAPEKEISAEGQRLSSREIFAISLFFVILTFVQLFSTATVTLLTAPLALLFVLRKSSLRHLQDRMSIAMLGFFALGLMYGVGLLISPYDREALFTFYKYFGAFTLTLIVLCRFEKKHVRACLWGIMGYNVFHALLSIEGATTHIIYPHFVNLMVKCGLDYSSFVAGSFLFRLNGLYNTSNVTASLHAISLLIGLYLIDTAKTKRERFVAYELTGINALMFLACVSRGAMLCFGIAGIVFLVLQKVDHRLEMFFRIAISVVVTFACQIICARPTIAYTAIPLIITLLCGPVIAVLDGALTGVLVRLFSGRKKLVIAGGSVLVGAVLIYAICAVTIVRPLTVTAREFVTRTPDLGPGSYTVSGDWDGDPMLTVEAVDRVGLFIGGKTIYQGPLSEAEFTVNDDILRVNVMISAEDDVYLRNVTFSDGTELKLGYPLLPESLVNRIQGSFLTDSSFVLRMQYMIDALKIFAMSPIWGCGLGSTEALYTAVQDVYYQSMYVHNHLIQYLADTGILGLLAYVMLAGGVLLLLIRRFRKGDGDGFAAMMIAVWTMINVHSLIDFNFSIRSYLSIAILIMALCMIETEDLLEHSKQNEGFMRSVSVAAMGVSLVYILFFGISLETYRIVHIVGEKYETTDYDAFMEQLETFITLDMYEDTYYILTYTNNAVGNERYIYKAAEYARDMVDSKCFTKCDGIAQYFYLPAGDMDGMFRAIKNGIWQKAADKDSWNIELQMLRNNALPRLGEVFMPSFMEGVLELRDYYISYNEDRLQKIELTPENEAFLDGVLTAWKSSMSNEEVREFLMNYSNPDEEPIG